MSSPAFVILAFDHPLRAVESVGHGMAAGLHSLGIDASVVVVPRDNQRLVSLLAGPICGVLSLGSLPLSVLVDGRLLHRWLNCPVWLYFLDALIYDLARVPATREFLDDAANDPRLIPISPEAGYQSLLGWSGQRGFWPGQSRHVPFGCFPKLEIGANPVQRQPRLCVIGTIGSELGGGQVGESFAELVARTRPTGVGDAALGELAAIMHSTEAPAMPSEAAMRAFGWEPLQLVDAAYLPFLCALDSWTKRERRLKAARSLMGLPVDFFGNGWQQVLGDVSDFRYRGDVGHDDIALLMTHYAGVVNFDPNWSAGVHDRVYTAVAMGTTVLTNDNTALGGAHLPKELVRVYDANQPQLAPLAHEAIQSATMPALPRLEVMSAHGWSNRMARLVQPALG